MDTVPDRKIENIEIHEWIKLRGKQTARPLEAWLLAGGSLFAFVSLGLFVWEIKLLALLALVVLVHEAGHLLAMKIYKYKNLKMMFLPFLGGLAIGESEEQDAYKIAMISIYGPLVGFLSCLVSATLGIATGDKIFFDYAYLSLLINALNLLPITPLDGGQFLNELLFSRSPKAELIFKLTASVALGYASYQFGSWLFGIPAAFLFFSALASYRMAKLSSVLREREGFKSQEITEEKIASIREEIDTAYPYLKKEKSVKVLANMVSNMWIRSNKRYPSVATTVFLLLFYLVLALGGPAFTLGFIHEAKEVDPAEQTTTVSE